MKKFFGTNERAAVQGYLMANFRDMTNAEASKHCSEIFDAINRAALESMELAPAYENEYVGARIEIEQASNMLNEKLKAAGRLGLKVEMQLFSKDENASIPVYETKLKRATKEF